MVVCIMSGHKVESVCASHGARPGDAAAGTRAAEASAASDGSSSRVMRDAARRAVEGAAAMPGWARSTSGRNAAASAGSARTQAAT